MSDLSYSPVLPSTSSRLSPLLARLDDLGCSLLALARSPSDDGWVFLARRDEDGERITWRSYDRGCAGLHSGNYHHDDGTEAGAIDCAVAAGIDFLERSGLLPTGIDGEAGATVAAVRRVLEADQNWSMDTIDEIAALVGNGDRS